MSPKPFSVQYTLQLITLLGATFGLVFWPEAGSEAVKEGLLLCSNVIIPSLFPFFILSSMVVELGLSHGLGRLFEGIMVPLFRVNGTCATALALGFVGGYPVGARTTVTLYQNGQCSEVEGARLLAFSNNSGPAFVLGVVGAGIFHSPTIGGLLYLAHVLGCLIVGMLFRFYKPSHPPTKSSPPSTLQATSFSKAFVHSVTSALTSTLHVCAFLLCFTVLIRLLSMAGVIDFLGAGVGLLLTPLGVPAHSAHGLVVGFIELASGVTSLAKVGEIKLPIIAFLLGWGGISVHCQVLAFLGESGLSLKTYFIGKFLHGVFSAIIIWLIAPWVPSPLTTVVPTFGFADYSVPIWVPCGIAICVWGILSRGRIIWIKTNGRG
ncbi:MAG: sporulation protein [Eubacteriales bacterium]